MAQEDQKKIRVLQIAGGLRANVNGKPVSGGVAAFLSNYCPKTDLNRFSYDFLALRNQCFEQYRSNLEKMGSRLIALGIQSNGIKRTVELIGRLHGFLVENKYDVVHIHMGSFFPVLCCAIAAKWAGVPNVIAHSHSMGAYSKTKRLFANLCAPLLTVFADQYCACSKLAAENLFSKRIIKHNKYKIIRNSIDLTRFAYREDLRAEVRKKLSLDDAFVLGHVGRFVDVKNHKFLINVFAEVKKSIPNAKLLLLGDGELRKNIEAQISAMHLEEDVLLMGQQSDPSPYYNAMDAFILPSFFEGLPIVVVEAQTAGLPCYVSASVTKEVKFTDTCRYLDLQDGEKKFASEIISDFGKNLERKDQSLQARAAGYDIRDTINEFESLYT